MLSSNGDCVALYAGLHGLAQGLDQVLAAAEIMGEEGEVKFVLIGDGPEKKRLVREARDRSIPNVAFLEMSAAKDIPALLASADMALVTLKTHISGAVPSKLYEAMASGLPVVLVADGEAAEIVRQYDAGITVRPGDVQGLISALQTLIHDQPMRHRLGENGRRVAEKYFDRTIIANRFIDYLETQLAASLPGLSK
jgi:glycosyltransferase involved in cell wall biosynthesis